MALKSIIPRAQLGNIAFFLCDMQTAFRNVVYEMPHVIATCKRMLDAGKIFDVPAVASEQYPKGLGKTIPELDISHTFHDSKLQFSMYTPRVKEYLNTTGKKQIALFGIETHVCILQTALDLLEDGYEVYIICDAVSSQRPLDRSAALQRLSSAGATLTTSESLFFDMMRTAEYKNFKEISKLLRDASRPSSELSRL